MRGDVGRRADGCPLGGDFECRSGGQKGPNHEAALKLIARYLEAQTKTRLPGMPLETVDQRLPLKGEPQPQAPSVWGPLGAGGAPLTPEMRSAIAAALGVESGRTLEGSIFSVKMDSIGTPARNSPGAPLGEADTPSGPGPVSEESTRPEGVVEANAGDVPDGAFSSQAAVLRVVAVSPRVRDNAVLLRVETLPLGGGSPLRFIMKLFIMEGSEQHAGEHLKALHGAEVSNTVEMNKILNERGASGVSKGLYLPLHVGCLGDEISHAGETGSDISTKSDGGESQIVCRGGFTVYKRSLVFPDAVADALQLYEFAAETAARENVSLSSLFPVPLRTHMAIRLLLTTLKLHGFGMGYGPISPEEIVVLQDGSIKIAVTPLSCKGGGATAEPPPTEEPPAAVPRIASAFLAPEQAKRLLDGNAEAPQHSTASDMWSVGAVSFYLLTGQRPFLAPSEQRAVGTEGSLLFLQQQAGLLDEAEGARQGAALDEDVESLILKQGAPPAFARLVHSMLQLQVDRRPSADSVLSEVRALVSSTGS